MPVRYNGKNLIPGPMAVAAKVFDTTEDGKRIGSKFSISLQGKLVVNKGSPSSSGTFWTSSGEPPDETIADASHLTTMLRKMEALRVLFADEGKTLEIQGYDGATPWSCNPRLKGPIEFQRGPTISWYNILDYTINFEADTIRGLNISDGEDGFAEHVERASETWTIEPTDEINRVYKLSHAIAVKGKRHYNSDGTLSCEAWQQASGYALNRVGLGIDSAKLAAGGTLNLNGFNAYNYTRRQTIGEADGTFNLDEHWTCISGSTPAIENYTVTNRTAELNKASVSIEGNIQGLEVRDNTSYAFTSSRWANAQAKWATSQTELITRAQNVTGLTLNSAPLNNSVSYNEINGTINYTYEYNNRAGNSIPGALTERIEVSYDNQADVFASIPILGRGAGPLLQNISTLSAKRKSLTMEALVSGTTLTYTAVSPSTDAIVATFVPAGTTIFKERDSENWNPKDGRYTRQVSWVYE